eukprot:3579287-Amphidinium_carterae.1
MSSILFVFTTFTSMPLMPNADIAHAVTASISVTAGFLLHMHSPPSSTSTFPLTPSSCVLYDQINGKHHNNTTQRNHNITHHNTTTRLTSTIGRMTTSTSTLS